METEKLEFHVEGAIFQVNGERTFEPGNWRPGLLRFEVTNGSGEWIDVVVESTYPAAGHIWQSGHIGDGASVTYAEPLQQHRGKHLKVYRWRPGILGIPGTGGGEFKCTVPDDGDVTIVISVTG